MSEKEQEKGTTTETVKEGDEVKEIKVIERIFETKEIAPSDAFGKLTRSQVELIKRTIAKDASDDELRMFIQVCKGAQLNPFMKQVHLIPRWDSKNGIEVRTIQVSIDGFRAIAESSGQYAGNDDAVFDGDVDVKFNKTDKETKKKVEQSVTAPQKATVTVYKVIGGQRYPFTATARWSEYYPGPLLGFQWHIRPFLMLGKCAEALALRKAFPKLLSGMYAQEEMEKGSEEVSDEQKSEAKFKKLVESIKQLSLKELTEYKDKMVKSDKYNQKQKDEFMKIADARIAELSKKPEKPTGQKVDEGIPIIEEGEFKEKS